MKKFLSASILLLLFGGLLAACGSDSGDDPVRVSDAWTRVTAPGVTTGAVYADLESSAGDKLTGVSVPPDIAAEAEIHQSAGSGDMATEAGAPDHSMMMMKPVSSIDLPAGEEVGLAPGGYHIMMLELAKPIEDGESVPVTLSFERGDEITVDATAREG